MSLPTAQQLQQEKSTAEKKLKRLQEAYDSFVSEWEHISSEEADLIHELRDMVDKTKMHTILNTISSIKG